MSFVIPLFVLLLGNIWKTFWPNILQGGTDFSNQSAGGAASGFSQISPSNTSPGTGNMWQASNWQGASGDGGNHSTPAGNQPHHAGNQQGPEEFGDMFRMLEQGQEFNDLSGMFNTFTD